MASHGSRHECSICLDSFTEPKLLPCFHTFCKNCLDSYIKSHARFNKFNCPNCRQKIDVPKGGAGGFTANFYLEGTDAAKKYYCSKHKENELDFYCRECNDAICINCSSSDNHENHNVVPLCDVNQEIRSNLETSRQKLEKKLKELNAQHSVLKDKVTNITKSAVITCAQIDQQVEIVCAKAKELGAELKLEAATIRDLEIQKFNNLMKYINTYIDQIQSHVNYSRDVLSGTSTKQVADLIPSIEQIVEDSSMIKSDIPVVKHTSFKPFETNLQSLKQQVGKIQSQLEGTFTVTFNVDQIKEKGSIVFGKDSQIIQNLPWVIAVKNDKASSNLGIYLHLRKGDGTVKSCTADRLVRLVHPADASKSIAMRAVGNTYEAGGVGFGWKFIDWDRFVDLNMKWIEDGKFTIQASIKIIHIEKIETANKKLDDKVE